MQMQVDGEEAGDGGLLGAVEHVVLCTGLHESLEGVIVPPLAVAAVREQQENAAAAMAMEMEG